jgi:hypothetical protein
MQSSSTWRIALPPVAAIVLSLVLPLAHPLAVAAQDDDSAANSASVARIDAISGDVAIQRGDSNETFAAVPNAPVLGADYVTTGPNGRAEVGFDGHSAVRLGENVQIRFSNIDPDNRQIQLAAGTVDLRLFGDMDGQSVIDTPSISVVPRTSGSFRVSVDEDGTTAVTVRAGRADIVTPQGTQALQPGTTIVADGPAANPHVTARAAIALDSFDRYNSERDHIYEVAVADSQYVNTNIQGIGDLNDNGRWADDGTYGNVWIPTNVAPDWAPYRDGNWTWEDGYGWTWVAAEPWGWAPYHYGRWYFSTAYHHWAWYPPAPGRFAPAWSPALVGFIGFNVGAVSVGLGFGNVGWVPLAPFEAFHPWWGHGGTTIVNNTALINNVHYRNLAVNNAITSVTRDNFQNGRFERRTIVSQEQLRSLHTVGVQGALPIVPSRANLRFTERSAPPSVATHAFNDRTFAGRPFVAQRTPFTQQQASVSQATRVAFHSEAGAGTPAFSRGAGSTAPTFARPEQGAAPHANDPWSRFNANRNLDRPNANVNAPSFSRGPAQASAPQYNRQEAPQYQRQGTPSFGRGPAPSHVAPQAPAPRYDRQEAPQYQRQGAPSFSRGPAPAQAPGYSHQAAPAYSRQSAPAYSRQAAPAYSRPAPAARGEAPARVHAPAAHETHENEGHRGH